MSAYDRHWARLAQLLGADEAAAERARMTRDERDDLRRKRVERFKRKDLPYLRECLVEAEATHRDQYAARLRKQIAYRERVIREEES